MKNAIQLQDERSEYIYRSYKEGRCNSFRQSREWIKSDLGINIDRHTISRYVRDGIVEQWAIKNGYTPLDSDPLSMISHAQTTNYWEKTYKDGNLSGRSVLKKIPKEAEVTLSKAIKLAWEDFKRDLPNPPKFKKIKRKKVEGGTINILDPADIHLQKMPAFNDRYSMHDYIEELDNAVDAVLDKFEKWRSEVIVIVIGNDILHVDNKNNTTTAGTGQDSVAHWHQAYTHAFQLYVRTITKCREIAKVHVIHNMSNHDEHLGWCLAQMVETQFKNAEDVTFDVTPEDRKVFAYGGAVIGFAHGDNGKPKDYAEHLPWDAKEYWQDAKSLHYYLHHRHHHEVVQTSKDYVKVTVETLRSPSVTDNWHNKKMYESIRAISGFSHDVETGFQIQRINQLIK